MNAKYNDTKYNDDLQKTLEISLLNKKDDDILLNDAITASLSEYSLTKLMKEDPLSSNDHLMKKVLKKLNSFQKKIFSECIAKGSGGLSLPLGSGKTLLSLVLSLYFTRHTIKPVLIIVSKSLIGSWEIEIKKFFGNLLKYELLPYKGLGMWKIKSDTNIVLTTVDMLAKCYKDHDVADRFIKQKYDTGKNAFISHYKIPKKPFLKHTIGGGYLFSKEWGCLIVDEVQKYTNIETKWCQALGAISSKHRWALSGTMFDEPQIKRILGYHIILNVKGKPRNMPDTKTLLSGDKFKGLNETLIHRKENKAFKPPKVNEVIIKHKLSNEEEKIYITMKKILTEIQKRAHTAKLYKDEAELQKFNSYKLVMITYLRQILLCPIIPITSIALNASSMSQKSELSTIIMDEVNKLGLKDWLNKEESIKSSRLTETLKCIKKHDEKVIVFSCFKSFLDIGEYLIKKDEKELKGRSLFRMTSKMNSKKRSELIKSFEKSDNGILLLTYQLGAEGLNLQFASTVLLVDFWWNASKEQQAIGRIFRYGQVADTINVYFFTANTGIEKILFKKQQAKLQMLEELKTGKMNTKIPLIKIDDIIKLIGLADNEELLKKIKFY
jgi:SNF2 family DNA or RNA helicase